MTVSNAAALLAFLDYGTLPGVRASRIGLPCHTSSRHKHALQCSSALPAVPVVPASVPIRAIVPASVPIIAVVSGTVPIIAVVPGGHNHGRGIHHGRWWGDDYGRGSDEDREWQPNRDLDPGVSREGQGQTNDPQECTQ